MLKTLTKEEKLALREECKKLRTIKQETNKKLRIQQVQNREKNKTTAKKRKLCKLSTPVSKPSRKIKCKSLGMYSQAERTLSNVIDDLKSPSLPLIEDIGQRSVKFRLRPSKQQKKLLQSMFGVYRFTYNAGVALYNDPKQCQEIFKVSKPPIDYLSKHILETTKVQHDWISKHPFNIRQDLVLITYIANSFFNDISISIIICVN